MLEIAVGQVVTHSGCRFQAQQQRASASQVLCILVQLKADHISSQDAVQQHISMRQRAEELGGREGRLQVKANRCIGSRRSV